MENITINGVIETPENCPLHDGHCIAKLNSIKYSADFVEHINSESLKNKLNDGYMSFEVVETENDIHELYVKVTYSVMEDSILSDNDLEELKIYTKEQLSTGLGEIFSQTEYFYNLNNEKVYIQPWFYGQILTTTIR